MKICYIAEATSVPSQRWINHFAQKGHEAHLISWVRGGQYDASVRRYWLARFLPQLWSVTKHLGIFTWPIQSRQLVNKIKPDIIEGHWLTTAAVLTATSGFTPIILNAWGSGVLVYAKRFRIWRNIIKYALKKAAIVTCNSRFMRDELIKLNTHPDKIRIIYPGVKTEQFSPKHRSRELRDKLQIGDDPTVISTRNLRPIYNVELLIKAIPSVLAQIPEAKFVLCGDGQQGNYLQSLAKSLGVSNSIRFTGSIAHSELPGYLSSSDVYVSTSLSDSSSMSLHEAMSTELPVVLTDHPSNRELIDDNETGFLVSPDDEKGLAKKILLLLKDKELAARFGKSGRQLISKKANYDIEMQKVEKIYQELSC
ncbi:MAG: glycosyltransferase [Chloroflexi bacterium]|jgi:L-malate glycosyltransferase|nr:glycosyltransferase [Chloroflexota bacterium]MBT7289516.1 glycosyltransferase [Chloroflexota bacterium]